ncbi:unnamed protein product [Euphydryas editha]|uniref:Uncharacterized protein n=1 Tax=Euphydryas editha TaxID=104508 RepID=A0AAU9TY19_EUPED|nr:unnamed protein product [Euphydryas editha]
MGKKIPPAPALFLALLNPPSLTFPLLKKYETLSSEKTAQAAAGAALPPLLPPTRYASPHRAASHHHGAPCTLLPTQLSLQFSAVACAFTACEIVTLLEEKSK